MAYCEDYPACGHTPTDPCERQWYDEPWAFNLSVNPHCFCEHEYGICQADDVDYGVDDPDTCEHTDKSYYTEWRGEELWYINRECDRCYTDLPDERETDPEYMEFYRQ